MIDEVNKNFNGIPIVFSLPAGAAYGHEFLKMRESHQNVSAFDNRTNKTSFQKCKVLLGYVGAANSNLPGPSVIGYSKPVTIGDSGNNRGRRGRGGNSRGHGRGGYKRPRYDY